MILGAQRIVGEIEFRRRSCEAQCMGMTVQESCSGTASNGGKKFAAVQRHGTPKKYGVADLPCCHACPSVAKPR